MFFASKKQIGVFVSYKINRKDRITVGSIAPHKSVIACKGGA